MTPDQMNTDALLQSRDYFAGASTGFSNTEGNEAAGWSTYGLHDMADTQTETGFSTGRTDVAGTVTVTEDELRATFNVPRQCRVITIPTVTQFDNGASGSDDELSELSVGQ